MPLVQVSKLRSQLNALVVHFEDPVLFQESLKSLFMMYEQKEIRTNQWLNKNPQSSAFNIPDSVMTELETRVVELSRKMPNAAIKNADILWQNSDYESKRVAIALISNLGKENDHVFLQRVQSWLAAELDDAATRYLLSSVEAKPAIIQNEQWLAMIKAWLDSGDLSVNKLGLYALGRAIPQNYRQLPKIFGMLTHFLSSPQLGLQKELVNAIQALIKLSEAETASFFLSIGELYPSDEGKKFLRKCLPFFDTLYQTELKRALSE